MSEERLLNEGEAALVFRRAAELEATPPGEHPTFDTQTLERIGVEAGLSPAAIRQAVAELRAGRLAPTERWRLLPGPVPAEAVIERRLSSPSSTVNQRLETYLRHQMFRLCRRRGTLTVWEPNKGLLANVVRGTDVIDRIRLSKVDSVQLHVEARGSETHVRIVLGTSRARNNARAGSITGAAFFGGAVVVMGGVGVAVGMPEVALVPLPFSAVGAAASVIGARSNYAKKVKRAVDAVELVLDELEHRT